MSKDMDERWYAIGRLLLGARIAYKKFCAPECPDLVLYSRIDKLKDLAYNKGDNDD
jgi:hypothetical protein